MSMTFFNSRLTVADARAALEQYVASASLFVSQLNQVCERLQNSGKYKGSIVKVKFQPIVGYITLPPYYLSVLGGTFNRCPVPVFGEWHRYQESGAGIPREAASWIGQLQDLGDGFCTQRDVQQEDTETNPVVAAEPGAIRIYSTGSDNGKVVRLFGVREETGEPIIDNAGNLGENITLTAPFVDSVYHYSSLTDVIKPTTNAPLQVWVVPQSGTANYQIGTWLTMETRPRYHRYFTGHTENAVEVLCQRRFVPVRAETDWVIPGNLAALKFGLKALRHEDSGYEDKAAANWAESLKWLDDEATATRGGAAPSIPVDIWGWKSSIPQHN
jgi:hypothetical protein